MHILLTGGAGYIGTHTLVELIAKGHTPIVVDSLANSSQVALDRVAKITGVSTPFYHVDCTDKTALGKVFDQHPIEAVIHFAGLKAVGDSVAQPLRYYRNNINSTLTLCEVMQEKDVKKLIFSSSAVVYGDPQELPLRETSPVGTGITNPYGQTKYMIEQILRDIATADPEWHIASLRYFNPIGAHPSGLIGEDPNDTPANLLPYISQVAVGKLDKLRVYSGYETADNTGIRDYIHVLDLADGHIAALEHLNAHKGYVAYNLGTGQGTSVFELLHAFEKACNKEIPYEVAGRRPGDVDACYADPSKANKELDWHTTRTIQDACADAWRWQSQNPNGYKSTA